MPLLSICMVSLDCWDILKDCLDSLHTSLGDIQYEIVIVDNASSDHTPDRIKSEFPDIQLIENQRNVGFTKATNQAIERSRGSYILWLNTDTILRPDTLSKLLRFMDENPRVGIVGPKVLNLDGTFQPQCRRGLPTPLASFCYLLKLDRFFPRSRIAGQYLLTHLPVDAPNPVDSVSGCCLLTRRIVCDDIGRLDETFFGFGEDLDWCLRAKKKGWEVWYFAGSEVTHLKGKGGVHTKPYHKVWGIHQAMWLFYRKHLSSTYPGFVNGMVWLAIIGSSILSGTKVFLSQIIQKSLYRFT